MWIVSSLFSRLSHDYRVLVYNMRKQKIRKRVQCSLVPWPEEEEEEEEEEKGPGSGH